MKRYIIDGYNALFFIYQGDIAPSLENARKKLIAFLEEAQRSSTTSFIVVFDAHERRDETGYEDSLFHRSNKGSLEIVFTGYKETADVYIERFFISLGKKSNDCLVTSDKRLSYKISSLGFETAPIQSFFSHLVKKKRSGKKNDLMAEKSAAEHRINSYKNSLPVLDKSSHSLQKERAVKESTKSELKDKKSALKATTHIEDTFNASSTLHKKEISQKSASLPAIGDNTAWQALFETLFEEYELYESGRKSQRTAASKKKNKRQ